LIRPASASGVEHPREDAVDAVEGEAGRAAEDHRVARGQERFRARLSSALVPFAAERRRLP
jgi:hypothetical protein